MNKSLMMISKYSGYFHDGAICAIFCEENKLIISLESAEIIPEWKWDRKNIPLSKRNTLAGKMHFEKVKSVKENNHDYNKKLEVLYDCGEIDNLIIQENKVLFFVSWKKYGKEYLHTDIINIEIEAEKIYWENLPDLFDAYWFDPN